MMIDNATRYLEEMTYLLKEEFPYSTIYPILGDQDFSPPSQAKPKVFVLKIFLSMANFLFHTEEFNYQMLTSIFVTFQIDLDIISLANCVMLMAVYWMHSPTLK